MFTDFLLDCSNNSCSDNSSLKGTFQKKTPAMKENIYIYMNMYFISQIIKG